MPRINDDIRVRLEVNRTLSVQEAAKVFEGLRALNLSGDIRLQVAPGRDAFPRLVRLVAANGLGERSIAIDLADRRDLFSPRDLRTADVYFKRSFCPASLERLPPGQAEKVQPFGLNNPVIRRSSAINMLGACLRAGRPRARLAADARQLFSLPSPRDFENAEDAPADALVLFQTRVWPAAEDDAALIALNEERADVVRTLKRAFGRRFVGGLIPTELARRNYPDLITSEPYGMRAYPALVARALVGVYSRGIHGSTAFKMSEYLAAARCIVGHCPEGELPEPLVDGRHYLAFQTPDECAARCEELLSSPGLAREMRRSNRQYYTAEVEPRRHLRNTLERAFVAHRI